MPRPTDRAPWGSKSTSRTRRPNSARAAPRLIVVVVLPTPPFWLQTATTRAGPCLVSGSGWGKTGRGRPVGPVTSSATRDAATICCTSQRGRTESLRWDPDSRGWGAQRQADSPFAGRIRAFRSLTAPDLPGVVPPGQHGPGPVTEEPGRRPSGGSGGASPGLALTTPGDAPRR